MPLLIFLIGLCIGSFLNVLIDRLPQGESVMWGRSRCDHCRRPLRWFELVPVASFVIQRGRCLRCHKPLSVQYPAIELATALGFLFIYLRQMYLPVSQAGTGTGLLLYLLLFSSLLVLFVVDLKYQILPDSMIVAGIVAAIGMIVMSPAALTRIPTYLLSALGSFVFLYLLWAVTRGRGMGFGDVKLAILMGLLLGFPNIVIAFYVAFLTGALVGVILILIGRVGWKSSIAFGPFLILGTAVAMFWGQEIMRLWQHFL